MKPHLMISIFYNQVDYSQRVLDDLHCADFFSRCMARTHKLIHESLGYRHLRFLEFPMLVSTCSVGNDCYLERYVLFQPGIFNGYPLVIPFSEEFDIFSLLLAFTQVSHLVKFSSEQVSGSLQHIAKRSTHKPFR